MTSSSADPAPQPLATLRGLLAAVEHQLRTAAGGKQVPCALPELRELGELAEADVLVFPYAQPRFAAVSGAVRVGLAGGVPVLTTPTTWWWC